MKLNSKIVKLKNKKQTDGEIRKKRKEKLKEKKKKKENKRN